MSHSETKIRVGFVYTAFSRKVVGKSGATSPKRIVGAFRFNVFQKKFERMALEAMEYSCEC